MASRAAVLVLGDLNRSPRMLNHCKAISLLLACEIDLIGFDGGVIRSDIANDKKITTHHIPLETINNILKKLPRFLFILSAMIRILLQVIYLIYLLLFKLPHYDFLLLQNPPGIPAMYICSVICSLRRSKFILDWHNYGYSILKVNNRNKVIVYVAKLYEKLYGRCADLNFCVSNAMKRHLKAEMGIEALTLPDRAIAGVFRHKEAISSEERDTLMKKYKIDKEKRIMISSTSWTPDEDFDLLLESFILAEKKLSSSNDNDKVLFLITGRGPMKDRFFRKVTQAKLKVFDVTSLWLDSDDYPLLLAQAEIGVCLHYSSSGFDLPMKVVDMFAAGLPVAAVDYDTIQELVEDKVNGLVFKSAEALSEILVRIVNDRDSKELAEYRRNLRTFQENDWVSQWRDSALDSVVRRRVKYD